MKNYFPKLFGNEKIKKLLGTDALKKTCSHAYIIEGAPGSGKHTLALQFASALLCTGDGDSLPCGHCPSCRKIADGYETDIMLVNCGDKASIGVDVIRNQIKYTLDFAPDNGDYKFYIIENAEKMTAQAQNALLLSLEEPPEFVVFLLLTTDAHYLLETVRSRAPVIRTELFSPSVIKERLKTYPAAAKADETTLDNAAAISGGAIGAALEALDGKSELKTLSAQAKSLVETLCLSSRSDAVIACTSVKHSTAEYDILLKFAAQAVRDMISVKCGSEALVFYSSFSEASRISARLSVKKLSVLYDRLCAARRDITQFNASSYAVMATMAASALS